jgi:hypothetical protein
VIPRLFVGLTMFSLAFVRYWRIRGLAQTARLLFEYTGTAYEDVLYEQGEGPEFSNSAWLTAKPGLAIRNSFMNLPYLIDQASERGKIVWV